MLYRLCGPPSPLSFFLANYPSFTARTIGVSNPIRSPNFCLSVSVSTQQSAFAVGVLSDLYAFHSSTRNFLCPYRTPACHLQILYAQLFQITLASSVLPRLLAQS
ncbi:hypothetical protein AHAS_Ahas19G0151100 [Arachis hypogaea]